ncbi:high potential iron-sulfur protein [Nitrincola tibetensis]|uniref:High-potential iron-sulfur protein n=1 Tax=Nitrincola tibetensis TaxID=2219697 RepID=A0A364NRP6_9GAMM|nr:high-potential iron-sulfur protein [Nitrincola tibetensis]RAU19763.1 high potential iron-sulfur protein [Nitrincola tibetensis]
MANSTRRGFLKKGMFGLAALPLGMGVLTSKSFAASLPPLSEDAPNAKALNYKKVAADASSHPAFKEGSYCDNCMFWQPDTQGCTLFQGFSVEAKGWCQSWVQRPGS